MIPLMCPMLLMTFNIRNGTALDGANRWELRREALFKEVRQHNPDVLGLQEAFRYQLDQIEAAVPGYGEIGVGRDDGKEKGEYSAILYRQDRFMVKESGTFWFSDTPEVPGSRSWGNTVVRICSWARLQDRSCGRAFWVFNMHLDHESEISRRKSAALVAERLHEFAAGKTAVVMGDFNDGEGSAPVQYLLGKRPSPFDDATYHRPSPGLVDTFRAAHPLTKRVNTFHGFAGGWTGEKIDYILVTRDVRTESAEIARSMIDGRFPSDHFPVLARVEIGVI